MKIWDGRRVETEHGYIGTVTGEAVSGEYTGRPVITVVLERAFSTYKAGDALKYFTSDVRVIG